MSTYVVSAPPMLDMGTPVSAFRPRVGLAKGVAVVHGVGAGLDQTTS